MDERVEKNIVPPQNTASIEDEVSKAPQNTSKEIYGISAVCLIYAFIAVPIVSFLLPIVFLLPIQCVAALVIAIKHRLKLAMYCSLLIALAIISAIASFAVAVSYLSVMLNTGDSEWIIAKTAVTSIAAQPDRQQAIENWCDILVNNKQISTWRLGTADGDDAGNTYILNKAAAQLLAEGEEIPKDLVVMFHGTKGWNQVGGKEKLASPYRLNVVPVFLGDYKTRYVRVDRIDRLRWTIQDSAQSFTDQSSKSVLILQGIITAAGICILIVRGRFIIRYSGLLLIAAAFSCLAGHFFAQGSISLYIGEPSMIDNYTTVYIISTAIATAFVLLPAPYISKCQDNRRLFLTAALFGGLCGLAASTLTHIYIMLYKETLSPWGIIGGAGYGIYAGITVAVATYWIMRLSQRLKANKQLPQSGETNG